MTRVSFYEDLPSATEIIVWKQRVDESLGEREGVIVNLVANQQAPPDFVGLTPAEVRAHFDDLRDEADRVACLSLLAAAEAVLRIDYLKHVYGRSKDAVGRVFRTIHKEKDVKARLSDDLLKTWVGEHSGAKVAVSEFRGALKFRDWLAHGRYWTPKLGQWYTMEDIVRLGDNLFKALPTVEGWPD